MSIVQMSGANLGRGMQHLSAMHIQGYNRGHELINLSAGSSR
ncbi:MAG: hypothetical protein RBR22_12155 [Desulfuromonas sp.]|nr:hypothetical protein [Desulfuromonas sp.]